MLASTMQHSTHNHTPTRIDHHHTERLCAADALDGPGQEQPYRETPTRCLLRTQQCAKRMLIRECIGSCSTQPRSTRTRRRDHESVESEIRTTSSMSPTRKPASRELVYPTNTVRLLRKEVIQPHLPVRLPCYDFVPIASPTFDNSLPQAG